MPELIVRRSSGMLIAAVTAATLAARNLSAGVIDLTSSKDNTLYESATGLLSNTLVRCKRGHSAL